MPYRVKEIYQTVQGEGFWTGRTAVFLRFSGCNLWSGREEDRSKGKGGCSLWCDTSFFGTDGTLGGIYSSNDLADKVESLFPYEAERFVVCTGGEPLLQLDQVLVDELHSRGFYVSVETNGTVEPRCQVDWLTVSPKAGASIKVIKGDELKLVYPQPTCLPDQFSGLEFQHFYLQPLDDINLQQNIDMTLDYCTRNPRWRISCQLHKFIGLR